MRRAVALVLLFLSVVTAVAQTGTLPIIYIETEGREPVSSKTEYLSATYFIVDSVNSEYNIGSQESPLPLEIRGRGHSSWRGNKKPYKIRLAAKAPLLGMESHRHWALLKFYEPTVAGLELGKIMGMDWTASAKPLEVVLNGKFLGLYLLTETNRISSNRLDIFEQPDGNEDEELLPYGWLVEIDNYREDNQISIAENSKWTLRITVHSPDSMSQAQKNWLTDEFKRINSAIYAEDKTGSTWEQMIDVDAMARFFIIQEVMDNSDGFHGSFYLHKDWTEDSRWVAGPIWDLSSNQREKTDYTFRMKTSYSFTPHWIGELIKDDDFCAAVRQAWDEFYPSEVDSWMEFISEHLSPCQEAYETDKKLWSYANQNSLSARTENLKTALLANIEWFNNNLPEGLNNTIDDIDFADKKVVRVEYVSMAGLRSSKPWPGINIKETFYTDGSTSTSKVIIKER